MKQLMWMTLAAVFCCAAVFSSCAKNEKDEVKDVQYTFEFTVSVPDAAVDQPDVIKTVIKSPDSKGVLQDHELYAAIESITLKPGVPYKDISKPLTLIIEQTLLPNRPVKDSYKLGLDYKLVVSTSDAKDGTPLDNFLKEQTDTYSVIRAENIAGQFPETMTFTVTIDAQGKISFDMKK